jgi:hypothetical protein
MTPREKFISIIIALFIFFIFISGLPYDVPIRARVFPWRPWNMFHTDSPWHQEIIARGVTARGDSIKVNIFDFSPNTTYAELEGNHFGWRFRATLDGSPEVRKAFCYWLLDRYNNSTEVSDQHLKEIKLSIGYWPKPPDKSFPPTHEKGLTHCSTNI